MLLFDLDDTLTESKQPMTQDMALTLCRLANNGYAIGIISGCSMDQMRKQVLPALRKAQKTVTAPTTKFYFLATSGNNIGTSIHNFKDVINLTFHFIPEGHKKPIYNAFWEATREYFSDADLALYEVHGSIAEDRQCQITFSMCGQQASPGTKRLWAQEYGQRRFQMAERMNKILSPLDLEVRVGGSTSLDVTQKGRDKAFGVKELQTILPGLQLSDITFIGDKLQPGGNDYPVKAMGVKSIEVSSVEDTMKLLKGFLGE
jgi:phosphomannomutase